MSSGLLSRPEHVLWKDIQLYGAPLWPGDGADAAMTDESQYRERCSKRMAKMKNPPDFMRLVVFSVISSAPWWAVVRTLAKGALRPQISYRLVNAS